MPECPQEGCSFESSEQGLSVHIGKVHTNPQDRGESQCGQCGQYFDQLSSHWSLSDCDHPELTTEQKEVAVGMLLGDAYIDRRNGVGNPRLETGMKNGDFVEWLSDLFGKHSCSVRHEDRSDYKGDEDEDHSYSDVYWWKTSSHPWFSNLASWYQTGKKKFPENINLTPLVAKIWYCCDGTLQNGREVRIYTHNEAERISSLCVWFEEVGFNPQRRPGYIAFRSSESRKLLNWMGEPPDGFTYKWDHEYI